MILLIEFDKGNEHFHSCKSCHHWDLKYRLMIHSCYLTVSGEARIKGNKALKKLEENDGKKKRGCGWVGRKNQRG